MNTRKFLKLLAMCVAVPFVPKPKPVKFPYLIGVDAAYGAGVTTLSGWKYVYMGAPNPYPPLTIKSVEFTNWGNV